VTTVTANQSWTRALPVSTLAIDVVGPLAVFYGLRAAGAGMVLPALLAAVLPALRIVYLLVRGKRVDRLAIFGITVIALTLLTAYVVGDARLLLAKDAWDAALIGVFLIGSVFAGRPAMLTLGKAIAQMKVGEAGARAWRDRWSNDARFRYAMRVHTMVFGVALALDAVVRVALVYAVPFDWITPVQNGQWIVLLALLITFHMYWTKRHDLRA
jgi:hypothetical protein